MTEKTDTIIKETTTETEKISVVNETSTTTPVILKQEEIITDGNDSDCVLVEMSDGKKFVDDSVPVKNGLDKSPVEKDVIEVDHEQKTVNGDASVKVIDVNKNSKDELENEISELSSIVREEIDITLDSAELEILDERVENSLNAELENVDNNLNAEEKQDKGSNDLKVTKITEETIDTKTSKDSKLTSSEQKNTTKSNDDHSIKTKSPDTVTTNNTSTTTSKQDNRRNLWICNISSETRANDLKQLFAKYGKVIGAKIVVSTRMPGSRCYGYVTVESDADADNCISNLNQSELHGSKIVVDKVSNDHEIRRKSAEKATSVNNNNNNDKDKDKDDKKMASKQSHSIRKSVSSSRDVNNSNKDKDKWKGRTRDEWQREIARERERLTKLEERMRRELLERQKQMERRIRDEERRLERDREELRRDREKLEREKTELWRLEREKARLERERLEREKEELRRQKKLMEEEAKRSSIMKRVPSPPTIRKDNSIRRGDRDDLPPPSKRRYDTSSSNDFDRGLSSKLPPSNPIHHSSPSYESEAAAYIARMDRESRQQHDHRGPKDLRYTLMETASYRNSTMDIPPSSSSSSSLDRKGSNRDHRFMDDSPKDHHRSYDRGNHRGPSPTTMKFNSMSNNPSAQPPANWRPVQPQKISPTQSDSMRWMGASGNATNNRLNPNPTSMYAPNVNVQRSGPSPLMMQSPWASQIGPPGTDFNVHNMGAPTGNYGMPSFDNYKGSSLTRNKY